MAQPTELQPVHKALLSLKNLLEQNKPCSMYAIVDTAQDSLLYGKIRFSPGLKKCLFVSNVHYSGTHLSKELAAVAPYLIAFDPDDPFFIELLQTGWGKNWFVFILSNTDFEIIAKHCSENLLAQTSDGRILQFRYYDPRILRIYIPTCTVEESTLFFGPMQHFCLSG
jgi:hypothetical protein